MGACVCICAAFLATNIVLFPVHFDFSPIFVIHCGEKGTPSYYEKDYDYGLR